VRNVAIQLGLVVVAIGVASRFGFELARAGTPAFLLWMAVPTIALALYGAFVAWKNHDLVEWVRPRAGDFTRGFVGAAVLFFGAWVFTHTLMPQGSPRESWLARLYLQLGDPSLLRKNVSFIVVAIIVMAIAEELVWRGLVIHLLEKVVGWRRAWIVSALLYAVAHLPTAWALRDPVAGWNPVIPLGALACGLVWGGMAHRYDRLIPSIISHALFDWTVVMMFRLWGPSV
jgi:membrane protease YdiL (CAAX protease family)